MLGSLISLCILDCFLSCPACFSFFIFVFGTSCYLMSMYYSLFLFCFPVCLFLLIFIVFFFWNPDAKKQFQAFATQTLTSRFSSTLQSAFSVVWTIYTEQASYGRKLLVIVHHYEQSCIDMVFSQTSPLLKLVYVEYERTWKTVLFSSVFTNPIASLFSV